MYYIIINNKWTPITAKTLRGAKRQATRRGADVVYETRESDRKDRYTGEAVNALISVAKKGLHWTRCVVPRDRLHRQGATRSMRCVTASL